MYIWTEVLSAIGSPMTGHVSAATLREALDVAAVAAQCRSVSDVHDHLLPALAQACHAEMAIYHQVALTGDVQEYGVFWPPGPPLLRALQAYPALMHLSPLVRHYLDSGDAGEISVGDLMSRRQWRAHPIYVDAFAMLDIDDHLAILLSMRDGRAHGFTVARSGCNFGAREHTLLALVAPHLRAGLRRALADTGAYDAIQTFPVPRLTRCTGPALRRPADIGDVLTPRQQEILALVAEGLGNKQIARRLDTSTRTVDKHLENAYRRLNSAGRVEALSRWTSLRHGEDKETGELLGPPSAVGQ